MIDREELKSQLTSPDEIIRLHAVRKLANESPELVECLLDVLGDESWAVRRAAVEGLVRATRSEIVPKVIQVLQERHHDFGVLNSALSIVSHSGVDAVEPLTTLLAGGDEELRIYAAQALGDRHDARGVAPLCEALDDADANVCYAAIEALGKMRAVEAVGRLMQIVETGDFFLAFAAIDSLVAIGDPRIVPRLTPLVQHDGLRDAVTVALGRLGDEQAASTLVDLLNCSNCRVAVIAEALVSLCERHAVQHGAVDRVMECARQRVSPAGIANLIAATGKVAATELRSLVVVMGWLEGAAIESCLVGMLENPLVREDAVAALARRRRECVGLLIEQLGCGDPDVRQAAVEALKQMGDPTAATALIRLLQTADSDTMPGVIDALAKAADQRATEPLLGLIGDPSPAIRRAAIRAINVLGHPELARRVLPLLGDPDPLVRESAVSIAGHFAFNECVDGILDCCRDTNPGVRRAAHAQLSRFADHRAFSTLVESLHNSEPAIRIAAVQSLGELKDYRALEPLLSATKDPDLWVRYHAVRALGQHRSEKIMDILTDVLKTDGTTAVRVAALEELGELDGAGDLLAAYANDTNADLSQAAIQALGRRGHRGTVVGSGENLPIKM